MSEQNHNEKPEVYALHQGDGGNWQISRRDFLKAAGLGAAAVGIGLNSRFVRPASAADDVYNLCINSLAHGDVITHLLLSGDGSYLLSRDSGGLMKCWNFDNYALLGTKKNAFSGKEPLLTATVNGEEAVFSASGYYTLPLSDSSSLKDLLKDPGKYNSFVLDREENVYALKDGESVIFLKKADGYQQEDVLYTSGKKIRSIRWMENSRKLFLQMDGSYAVLDPAGREAKNFYGECPVYAIAAGDAKVLICSDSGYRLCSLTDGSMIWDRELSDITGAAVTPDGSIGIIANSAFHVWLISMKDGSVLHDRACGTKTDRIPQIAVAQDGSKFAFAVGKSILFFSLPDLKVLGCPVDLEEMKDDSQGIEITQTNPITGRTETITMPCGSPIPEGAVCICNCVAGHVCTCDVYTVCTCDTVVAPCSCDGHRICTCDSQGHYWHPN